MKRIIEQPVRLVDKDPLPPELTEAQASLHAAASAGPELSESAQHRIQRRLQLSMARERSPRARLGVAVAFGVAMMVSGAVGATVGSVVTSWLAQSRVAKNERAQQRPTPERRRVPPPARSSSPPAFPEALPLPEMPPPATVRPRPSAEVRTREPPLRQVTTQEAVPTRVPMLRQAFRSSADVEPPALPKPSLAEVPSAMANLAVGPAPSPAVGPSGVPSPAVGPSGSLRHESRSVSAALGPRPEPANTSQASPGRDEAAILGEAIRLLRVQGNPRAALVLLDGGGPALVAGAFAPEVAALRIEVLLALGRTGLALDDLERLAIATLPRATEWLVVRAELRGKAGRWRAAEDDFAAALSARRGSLKPGLEERALWGRAVARLHRGNPGGARSDAEDYLRRFPHGRFRSEAEKAAAPPP